MRTSFGTGARAISVMTLAMAGTALAESAFPQVFGMGDYFTRPVTSMAMEAEARRIAGFYFVSDDEIASAFIEGFRTKSIAGTEPAEALDGLCSQLAGVLSEGRNLEAEGPRIVRMLAVCAGLYS